MKILGTGLNGLIGSRVVELLKGKYVFESVSRVNGVDITQKDEIFEVIQKSTADIVLHLAAYTDVKKAEAEKDLGKQSQAWRINVLGTENIVEVCKKTGKALIYASTDLVFDGKNIPAGGYREDDKPNPLSWYAKTKFEGEKRVKGSGICWTIIRPAYPYRANFDKKDFVRLFMEKLSSGETLNVLKDRIITPVFIDDLAYALDKLIETKSEGIYHTVGNTSASIAEIAREIAETFNFNKSLIHETTMEEFLVGRPPEPFNSSLCNAKIEKLGVNFKTLKEGLEEIRRQTYNL